MGRGQPRERRGAQRAEQRLANLLLDRRRRLGPLAMVRMAAAACTDQERGDDDGH